MQGKYPVYINYIFFFLSVSFPRTRRQAGTTWGFVFFLLLGEKSLISFQNAIHPSRHSWAVIIRSDGKRIVFLGAERRENAMRRFAFGREVPSLRGDRGKCAYNFCYSFIFDKQGHLHIYWFFLFTNNRKRLFRVRHFLISVFWFSLFLIFTLKPCSGEQSFLFL